MHPDRSNSLADLCVIKPLVSIKWRDSSFAFVVKSETISSNAAEFQYKTELWEAAMNFFWKKPLKTLANVFRSPAFRVSGGFYGIVDDIGCDLSDYHHNPSVVFSFCLYSPDQ